MDRNTLTILHTCIQNLCEGAALAVEANCAQLHVSEKLDAWEFLGKLSSAERQSVIAPITTGTQVPLGDFTAVETFTSTAFVSDVVDLTVDLLFENGETIARLVLTGVPRSWPSKNRKNCLDRLASVLSEHLIALSNGPRAVAAGMLGLIEELAELDASITTPTLTGFLRLLSGKAPTRSQLIALQISGLVDGHETLVTPIDVSLTETGREIILRSSLRSLPSASNVSIQPTEDITAVETPPLLTELRPHAKLRIMERDYLIAEHPLNSVLHYRSASESLWSALSHSNADGWTKVATEIIHADIDVLLEVVKTHLIRRRDLPTDEIAEAFEILGQIFWIRRDEAGLELRLEGGDWRCLDVDPELPLRHRAQAAALQLGQTSIIELDTAASDWAKRMAQAVQVSPYFEMAAE